jgi:hypothetical protein
MTISWQLTEISTLEYIITQVFGYQLFWENLSKGKLGAYFKYEMHFSNSNVSAGLLDYSGYIWTQGVIHDHYISLYATSASICQKESLSLDYKHRERGPNSPEAPTWHNVMSNRAMSRGLGKWLHALTSYVNMFFTHRSLVSCALLCVHTHTVYRAYFRSMDSDLSSGVIFSVLSCLFLS